MTRFSLQSMRKCRCRQHTLPESIIRMKSGYTARFAGNGFTMSAFTFEKIFIAFYVLIAEICCVTVLLLLFIWLKVVTIYVQIYLYTFFTFIKTKTNKQTKTLILSKTVAWKFSFSLVS